MYGKWADIFPCHNSFLLFCTKPYSGIGITTDTYGNRVQNLDEMTLTQLNNKTQDEPSRTVKNPRSTVKMSAFRIKNNKRATPKRVRNRSISTLCV